MKRFVAGVAFSALAIVSASAQTANGTTPLNMPVAAQQALVNKYCAGCHNDKLKSGGFSWSKIDLAHPDQQAEQVERSSVKSARA